MRTMTADFGGLRFELAANFGVAREIGDKVGDLLSIHREAVIEAAMMQNGTPYHPRFQLTLKNVPVILHMGAKAAGETVTMAQIENAMFEAGLHVGKQVALDYLTLFFVKGQEDMPSDEGRETAGE